MEIQEARITKDELKNRIEALLKDYEEQTTAKIHKLELVEEKGLNATIVKKLILEVRL